ncbi:MAG: rod shape-determining protein MreD [Rickettsiales bacterium]|jgi:cell shape-determining protein MreD|nr:rod shape-determining protein MreD [Rickettsiales bacterium]
MKNYIEINRGIRTNQQIKRVILFILTVVSLFLESILRKYIASISLYPNFLTILLFYSVCFMNKKPRYGSIFVFGILYDIINSVTVGFTSFVLILSLYLYGMIKNKIVNINIVEFLIFNIILLIISCILSYCINMNFLEFLTYVKRFFLDIIIFYFIVMLRNMYIKYER